MAESSSLDFNPMETWSKLVDSTLGGYPASQVVAQAAQNGKEDAWISFVDRLWEANPVSKVVSVDPGDTLEIFQKIWLDSLRNPYRVWSRYNEFVQQYTQLLTDTTLKFWGLGKDAKPVIEPDASDRRFSASDWQQNPIFDAIKQSYLLTASTMLKMTSEIEGLDEKQSRRILFYL